MSEPIQLYNGPAPVTKADLARVQKAMGDALIQRPAPDLTLFKFISQDAHEQAEKMAIVSDKAVNALNGQIDAMIQQAEANPGAFDVEVMAKLAALAEKLTKTGMALALRGKRPGGGKKEKTVKAGGMTEEAVWKELKAEKKEGVKDGRETEESVAGTEPEVPTDGVRR